MAFLDELLGKLGKGIGNVASTAVSGTRFGQNIQASEQTDFKNDLMTFQQIQNPDDRMVALKELMNKYPKLLQLQNQMSNVATQTLPQQQEAEKWNLLDQTEKKDMATRDQWGRRPQTTEEIGTLDEGERWMKIANQASSDELATKAEQKAQELLFPPDERQPESQEPGRYQFVSPGIPARDMKQEPASKSGGHSFSPGVPGTPPVSEPATPVDNRGLFSEGDNPFADLLNKFLDKDEGAKESPHTFEDIGIIAASQQQQFQELEKMVQSQMPDMDLRQNYALHPESFKKLFAAIRSGVPDQKTGDTRKLTTKEIMQAIQSMGR